MTTEAAATTASTATDLTVTPDVRPAFLQPAVRGVAVAATLVALADWLFYGQFLGISIPLFLLAVVAGVAAANLHQLKAEALPKAVLVFLISLAPLFVERSWPAFMFAVAGAIYFTLRATEPGAQWTVQLQDAFELALGCLYRMVLDLASACGGFASQERAKSSAAASVVWLIPILLGSIFVILFAQANPLIERWLSNVDLRAMLGMLSGPRILLWLVVLTSIWPLVFLVRSDKLARALRSEAQTMIKNVEPVAVPSNLFGPAAILRSLVVFNLLFAVQTGLDVFFLWGGAALPAGMSYASYAHRGAYPLIATALLAAAFVIAAMRPGSTSEKSPVIRALVFLWVAQNVLLVGSSILRLDLYVSIYSLTYWRLAAGIWMMLVAVGLVLIVVRIVLGQTNAWLIRMNAASLALTLYACCFVNFPHVIASYNVAHNAIPTEKTYFDLKYLTCLGAHAIPALDTFLDKGGDPSMYPVMLEAIGRRNVLAAQHMNRMRFWRAWTWQDHQLAKYLERNPYRSFGK